MVLILWPPPDKGGFQRIVFRKSPTQTLRVCGDIVLFEVLVMHVGSPYTTCVRTIANRPIYSTFFTIVHIWLCTCKCVANVHICMCSRNAPHLLCSFKCAQVCVLLNCAHRYVPLWCALIECAYTMCLNCAHSCKYILKRLLDVHSYLCCTWMSRRLCSITCAPQVGGPLHVHNYGHIV